jgi:hypothetical protein
MHKQLVVEWRLGAILKRKKGHLNREDAKIARKPFKLRVFAVKKHAGQVLRQAASK